MDRGIKKLLVVGEGALRDDLKSVIGGEDIQIITAPSGEAALSVLENERADAILLGAHLQNMGVLHFVQEVYKTAKTPIILFDDKAKKGDEVDLNYVSQAGSHSPAS